MLAMAAPSTRAKLWDKQRLTFILDPETHIRQDLDYDRGYTEDH